MAWMYILEGADGSYYVGSTRNLERVSISTNRDWAQNIHRIRLPVELVYGEEYERVTDAYAREKRVQGWRRAKREALINGDPELLPALAKKIFDKSNLDG